MKSKNFSKKLSLNKTTLVNLNYDEKAKVMGGATNPSCDPENTCDTCVSCGGTCGATCHTCDATCLNTCAVTCAITCTIVTRQWKCGGTEEPSECPC